MNSRNPNRSRHPLAVSKRLLVSILITILFLFVRDMAQAASAGDPAGGGAVVQVRGDRLTVRVQDASLERVLREIADQASIRIVLHGVKDETVSVEFSDLPIEKGLKRLVRNLNLALIYERKKMRKGEPGIKEIVIYGKDGRRPPGGIQGARGPSKPGPDKKRAAAQSRVSPESLLGALKDEDPAVREEAAAQLDALKGDKRFIRHLTAFFLSNENQEVKTRVGAALEDFLIPEVRLDMVETLEKIGGEKVVAPLKQALEDEDEAVRQAAAAALEKVIGRPVTVQEGSSPAQ